MKRLTLLLTCFVLSMGLAIAQTVKVSGTVVDESNDPIPGASVMVKGNTAIGAVTNVNGIFTLEVPSSAKTLVVKYLGMEDTEVAVASEVKVQMKIATNMMDEVIVVAYGTAKKSAFTGSAAVVSSEDLSKRVTSNVANALVGAVPGLQMRGSSGAPGAGSGSITIRGISSMYASTDPLIIVDGAPYPASLTNIPQGDIESISVLKDAASAALYGARGAGGVIIVTTKKGKTQSAIVNVDVKWGVNSRSIKDYDVIKDPGEYYEAYYDQLYNYYYYGQGYTAANANSQANTRMLSDLGYNAYSYPDGELLIGANGKLNPNATIGRKHTYNGTDYYVQPDDWTDMAYSNALRQEYNVSVNGSSDRSSFYASFGYLNEDGIIEYSGFERITARIKADYQAKSWLKIGANAGYVHSEQESNPNMDTSLGSTNLMYYTTRIAPIYPAYIRVVDQAGNVTIKKDQYGNDAYDYGVASTNYGLSRAFLQTGNPLGSNRYNEVTSEGNQLNATFTADVNITDFLKFNATSTTTWGLTNYSDYQNPFYGPKVGVNGEIVKRSTHALRTNNIQTLTFLKNFGGHSVTVLAGHEYYKTTTKFLEATATGGFSPDIPEINAFATKTDSKSYTSAYNVEGYFGNAQYNYVDKYYASASYRRDASSYFAKENRWGSFWSVGGAWIISKEGFMPEIAALDMLKIKASIGQLGQDNIGNWAYTDLYSLSKADDTSMSPSFYRIGNPDITWETTTNINAGIEFSFWKNRLTGNIDVYNKKTTDLLFWLSVPESAGSRGYYGNVGDLGNTGIELALAGSIVRTKDIDWGVTLNLSHNAVKILKLPAAKIIDNGGFTENSMWFEEGGSYYNAFRAKYAGVNDKGMATYWVDEDLAGITNRPGTKLSYTTTNPNEATRYALGSLLPKVFGGFGSSLRIGSFDASVTFDFQLGGKIYDSRYQGFIDPVETSSNAGSTFHKDYAKAWSPNNTSSDIPRWQYGDQYSAASSDRFLTNASYLNFQSFSLGYTLPKNLIKDVSNIRVYVIGDNLSFWSARQGLDPRYSFTGNTTVATYSPVRNFSGGIQVTF